MPLTDLRPADVDSAQTNGVHENEISTPTRQHASLCESRFVPVGETAHSMFNWELRDARIVQGGEVVFEQTDAEFPEHWSDTAVAIVTQKYARGALGSPERETSLKEIIGRVVDSITEWGLSDGYFDKKEAETFRQELTWILLSQRASFNSPVWFNIGVKGSPQQASACFILQIEDNMDSILEWYTEEGKIFQAGSGAGINLSPLRGSMERLSSGGIASGPVSFMRGADASAGAIKSGGRTRRSAKMVLIDDDHPDVREFVACKVLEEDKARALAAAGFDMSLHSDDAASIGFRNANHSVRVSDAFMQAVKTGDSWSLRGRTDGAVTDTVDAKDLLRSIAEAAHACGDPGVQYSDTINRWHTAPNAGPIEASNPCSEYLHINDSACNLASINLLPFLTVAPADDGPAAPEFDLDAFVHTCQVMILAQDILVTHADYPTAKIGANARAYRQLGLGFTNLGAMLMSMGLPYDSDEARLTASSVTALMGGAAYAASARIAEKMGPFSGYAGDIEACRKVMGMHRAAVGKTADRSDTLAGDPRLGMVPAMLDAAAEHWDTAVSATEPDAAGLRNSQATLLAPTGTISFMMDCDTTGIEPDFALLKQKQLVGGGFLATTNSSVAPALRTLGYDEHETAQAMDWLTEHGDFAPVDDKDSPLRDEHLDVFACAVGHRAISATGHMKMVAACQPFLSGAISKTVNLPADATVEDIEELIVKGHDYGIKALAIYRDNSKATQPLAAKSGDKAGDAMPIPMQPQRRKMPRDREARITKFQVGSCAGYLIVGLYEDGRPGEVFVNVAKEGTALSGMINAFGLLISYALQHGAPLHSLVQACIGMQFEPQGITDDPDLRFAQSLPDYIMRRLALDHLTPEELEMLDIRSVQSDLLEAEPVVETSQRTVRTDAAASAPLCTACGALTTQTGTCWTCRSCGTSNGGCA